MYNAFVKPILMYNASSLDLSLSQLEKMNAAHRTHLRRVLGIFYPNTISNAKLYESCNLKPISAYVIKARWTLFGHILRLPENTPAHQVMITYYTMHATHKKSGIQNILPTLINQDLDCQQSKIWLNTYNDFLSIRQYAQDRTAWRELAQTIYNYTAEDLINTLDQSTTNKRNYQELQSDTASDTTPEPPRKRRRQIRRPKRPKETTPRRPKPKPPTCVLLPPAPSPPKKELFPKFKKRSREIAEAYATEIAQALAEERPSRRARLESEQTITNSVG